MARILRGEIRWADLNPVRGREQAGLRPVLILSHDVFNDRSGTVIAVALTSQAPRAGFPLTLESKAPGLAKRSWIKISQIRTLAVERAVLVLLHQRHQFRRQAGLEFSQRHYLELGRRLLLESVLILFPIRHHACGRMFWFMWKKFSGSYFAFSCWSRR
jgi:mRNA interferase MazF